jgi:small multidrug resistance pump/quaternary ammonium compound-resistance protein SugE
MALLQLILASAAYAAGGLFMKASDGLTHRAPVALFVALFAGGSLLQALGMRNTDLGVGYIFVLGVEAVLAMALSVLYFHERLTIARAAAVALVVVGIVWLRRT